MHPWCALASALFWLCLWYTTICHRNVTKPPTVVMVSYDTNVLLVCFPTDKWTLVLAYDKGKTELLVWNTFLCIQLVVCLFEIIASKHSSNLIQHALFSYLCRIFSFQFTAQTFTNMINNSTQCLAALAILTFPIVKTQRQPTLQHTHAVLSLVLEFAHIFEVGTENWMSLRSTVDIQG